MNKIFSLKLYWEGIKKIRLVGFASAVLCVVVSALIPISTLLNERGYAPETQMVLEIEQFCIPLVMLLFLTPLFVFSMYSFLNHRNTSDFYHAIPYRRGCVYLSFTAAILTWLWAIVLVTVFSTALLWSFSASYVFPLTFLVQVPLAYFLATMAVAGITTVAMTITGNVASNIAITALLLVFVRVVSVLILNTVSSIAPVLDTSASVFSMFQPEFFLPFGILTASMGLTAADKVFGSAPVLLYALAVGVVMLALGGVFYCRRRSETATRSAPNRLLQHLYRCAVTLPFVLILVNYILSELFGQSTYRRLEMSAILILLVVTLLVYFLFELITTKRPRNLISAMPWLLVLVAGAGIFTGAMLLMRSNILAFTPAASEIESIVIPEKREAYSVTYEELVTGRIEIRDEKAKELVAGALEQSVELTEQHQLYEYWRDKESSELVTVGIRTKDGKTVGRTLWMSGENYQALQELFNQTQEYRDAYFSLPETSELLYISIGNSYVGSSLTDRQREALWETFRAEFATLSDAQKLEIKRSDYGTGAIALHVSGSRGLRSFSSDYVVPRFMTRTVQQYLDFIRADEKQNARAFEVLTSLQRMFEGQTPDFEQVELQCRIVTQQDAYIYYYQITPDVHSSAVSDDIRYVLPTLLAHENDVPSADGNYLIFSTLRWDETEEGRRILTEGIAAIPLTQEEVQQIVETLRLLPEEDEIYYD